MFSRSVSFGACAFVLILFLVGARRQDGFKEWVDSKPFDQLQHRMDRGGDQKNFNSRVLRDGRRPLFLAENGPVLGKGSGKRKLQRQNLMDLRNETLGFGGVQVINLKERSDKLDAMRLIASLTGFNFEVQEGVVGSAVSQKALAAAWEKSGRLKNGQIGCWRSHMAIARTILANNWGSALILEDDADWDVSFRSQLELVALGTQALLETPPKSVPHSPYGDGWDLIWLGHCASAPLDGDNRRFVIKNDPTVTPPEQRVNFGAIPDMSAYDNSTRIMYRLGASTCTYGYALSHHGAQKLLKWMSMDIYQDPVDYGLHDMCNKPERGMKCIGIFPQIIGDHKQAGRKDRDSDIASTDPEDVRKTGFSFDIVHSMRLNADALIDGRYNNITAQWPELMPPITGSLELDFTNDPPTTRGQ